MIILLTTRVSEKRKMQIGEKKREKTVHSVMHRIGVSYNVEFCMETAQRELCYSAVLPSTAVLPRAYA